MSPRIYRKCYQRLDERRALRREPHHRHLPRPEITISALLPGEALAPSGPEFWEALPGDLFSRLGAMNLHKSMHTWLLGNEINYTIGPAAGTPPWPPARPDIEFAQNLNQSLLGEENYYTIGSTDVLNV